ncbi:MAG: acyl-CoA dehydrogenase family protein [Sedimentisphaerales bacterium]|nr:acyl-CoA dehydrogenase family protein [Sedimentisphaerales bacterium]
MANFYKDNDDLQFMFRHLDIASISGLTEEGFKFAEEFDTAPVDSDDAITNYELVLNSVGQLSGDFIDPRSEEIDREGTHHDGKNVTYAKGIAESLDALAKAQVMGFTLPHRFGGLNFPETVYTMATEMVSRADAGLMNLFGLQGIAGTINAFASEEIKQEYLYDFAAGKTTGAMVLTEPDAGSDLQACQVKAFQDESGQWYLHGVKRFITNGCGAVLLVMARSEPDRSGGLGLSLFVCGQGPTVHIRRIEDKLGIHGSPTCEIVFDNTPCKLVGERQRGLVTYVMALMNGARLGIAAQSMGIAEATYRIARDYAASREQFGVAIEKLPAVRDMIIDMKIAIETARALLYATSYSVDLMFGYEKADKNPPDDKSAGKEIKQKFKKYKRIAAMLTPMSKYYCSEMCNTVAYDSIQVLGGSGFMRDYACERYARDARITTIYEGTSQLQVVAAVRGVCGGTFAKYIDDLKALEYDPEVKDLLDILEADTAKLEECIAFVKDASIEYMDLYGRDIVDIAISIINGYLLCGQASTKVAMEVAVAENGSGQAGSISMKKRKMLLARRYITKEALKIASLAKLVISGDKSTFEQYEALVGPTPEDI